MFTFLFNRHVLLTVVIAFMGLSTGFAQKAKEKDPAPAIKFGQIIPDQFLNVTTDSTAEAVALYDYGEVTFDNNSGNLWLVSHYHVRLQIRKKSAYDRATIELVARRGKTGQHEMITDFEGYTYNLVDGNVSIDQLNKTGHFTERASDQFWIEKYTLPNVREGSIIDYRYTVRTPFSVSYNPKTWRFQQRIPVNWSEYRITIPDYFYYKIMQTGYVPMTVNTRKPTTVDLLPGQGAVGASAYRFAMGNVPAFRNEAYITTDDDYMAKIEFELASYQLPGALVPITTNISVGWEAMDKTLLGDADFGGQFKRASFLRDKAKALVSQYPDTLGRITAAYDYIRQTIKWNQEAALWSRNIKKVFDEKKGDAADINLMLIALLREMDIDANPVILSTRSHGRISELYALLKKFNYVVAHVSVGGKDMLLDATDVYLAPGVLPVHCLNGTGRLVHPTKSRFISLMPVERDIDVHTGSYTLASDGDVSGTLVLSHGGYSALRSRKLFNVEGKTNYLESVQKKRTAWQIEKADFSGTDETSRSFNETYTITIPEACGRAGDRLYFRPMLTEAHGNNPFKEVDRLYPVDFAVLIDETFSATYTLPKGFQVKEMPKSISMVLPENGGRFLYQVAVNADNQLQVMSRILLRKTQFLANEYGPLRELFSRIVAKHAEQVVLKRIDIAEKK
ncbi:transglutaminase domain-containing protein [Spirosoma radiotolerans]|uniref:Transglutaminase n=1 Tax=Spirosoma radiotolerans TaxID=1379870 RepID=A0A0E3V5U1_9BACT|nr:transglutaminase domain-containing protein [Spirosoma radiotolerans]AKD54452.1 transglutaminase [Spirosoma radiotolerans]